MRTEFQRALAAADDQTNPDRRIEVIKKAVAAEVRAADPAVTVRTTEYFNHSFAPDLVLSWAREDRDRLVFVRPTGSADWLLDDLPMVSDRYDPMLFALEDITTTAPAGAESEAQRTQLAEAAIEARTWITDPSGMAAISTVRVNNPVLDLLGQALVRGGRGLANDSEIGVLAQTTTDGFVGAASQVADATRMAVEAIQGHLDSVQSGRLTRVLRAVWEGHGGAASTFPSSVEVGRLTDDDLTYLLSATATASRDFWRRVARTVTTEQLGRLRLDDPSMALQELVSANIDGLQAKGLRVLTEPHQLGESEDVPRWMVSRGCLALRGLNWVTYLAARKAEELPQEEAGRTPSLATLRDRATSRRATITRVQLGRGDRAVTYEARDGLDVMNDEELDQVATDMRGAAVETASLNLPGGGTVTLDFGKRTALGPTSSVFPIGTFVRSVLPLVSSLTDEELTAVARLLPEVDPDNTLF